MYRLICLVIGYFIGCLQFSYIIGKLFYKIDIREHGSGNAGATNAVRTLGAKAGFLVFAFDALKAAGAFFLVSVIFNSYSLLTIDTSGLGVLPGLYAALGVIMGHVFPFYLKFKGGKGMASMCGGIVLMDMWLPLISYAIAIGLIVITKYVSVASLVFTALLPIMFLFYGYGAEAALVGGSVAAICWYKHLGNIKRLLNGKESKITEKKKI